MRSLVMILLTAFAYSEVALASCRWNNAALLDKNATLAVQKYNRRGQDTPRLMMITTQFDGDIGSDNPGPFSMTYEAILRPKTTQEYGVPGFRLLKVGLMQATDAVYVCFEGNENPETQKITIFFLGGNNMDVQTNPQSGAGSLRITKLRVLTPGPKLPIPLLGGLFSLGELPLARDLEGIPLDVRNAISRNILTAIDVFTDGVESIEVTYKGITFITDVRAGSPDRLYAPFSVPLKPFVQ